MSHDDLKNAEPSKGDMGKEEFNDLREILRDTLLPLKQAELRRDLWPDMLRRMERPQLRVPWFDWALLAFTSAALIFFPALIPALLYQL